MKRTPKTYASLREDDLPGPNSAGQSGDDQGLSEDVAELAQEGQYFEAEAVSGLERPYPDEAQVRTREVPEDDVPFEYPAKDPALENE
jgi:hypothetical protein